MGSMTPTQRRQAIREGFAGGAALAPRTIPRVLALRAEGQPGLAEVQRLVTASNEAFEQFVAANNERLAEIERQGQAFPETTDKVNRLNDEVGTNARAIDDILARLGNLTAGGGLPAADRDREVHARNFYVQARRAQGQRFSAAEARGMAIDWPEYDAYFDAFLSLIAVECNADALPADVRNALQVGSDPSGGYVTPPEMSNEFITRLFDTSPMRQYARTRSILRGAWEQPISTTEGVSGGWVGERQARPTTGTPTVGMLRIPVHEQYAFPETTQEMLEDAVLIDPAAWLEDMTSDIMVRTENAAFVNGDGVTKPKGFLSYAAAATTEEDDARAWGVLQYVFTGAAGAFAATDPADPLITLVHKPKVVYRSNSRWAMNRATAAEVRKLKDGQGNYLWSMGNIQAGQPQLLMGYPMADDFEDMPDIGANSYSIAFGDFQRTYTIVDRLGITVLRDPYTNKPFVGFYIRKRVGGDVVNFDSLKLLKFATS